MSSELGSTTVSVSEPVSETVSESIPVPSTSEPTSPSISLSPSDSQPSAETSSASCRPTGDPTIPEESGAPSVTFSVSASTTISTTCTSESASESMSLPPSTTQSITSSVQDSGSFSPTRTFEPRPTNSGNPPQDDPPQDDPPVDDPQPQPPIDDGDGEMSTPREPTRSAGPSPSPSRSPSGRSQTLKPPPRTTPPPSNTRPPASDPPRASNTRPPASNPPPPVDNPSPSDLIPSGFLDPSSPDPALPSNTPDLPDTITSTSTLTTITSVESTFPTPVPVSVTDSLNGNVDLTTPPFVTTLSTSVQPDGQTVVVTQIVANPTGFVNSASSRPSFFEDQGKTAGVFLVVGIVVAALAFAAFFCFRRRRRQARQRQWLSTIPPPRNEDPFADPTPPPPMRETGGARNASSIWDGRRVPVPEYYIPEAPRHSPLLPPSEPPSSQPPAPPPPPPRNPSRAYADIRKAALLRQAAETDAGNGGTGLALIGDKKEFSRSQASFAQSSPSLYPQSLPPADDDDVSFYELESRRPAPIHTRLEPQRLVFPTTDEHSYAARMVNEKSRTFMLTPPLTSDSSSSENEPPSPDFDRSKMILPAEPAGVFTKPTLLNVRRRDTFGVV